MMKKTILIALLLALWSMAAPRERGGYDAVSAATGGGGGGTADKGQGGPIEHPSHALRPVLDARQKAAAARLAAQIDSCFKAIQALDAALAGGALEFDVMSIYLVIEEHAALAAGWDDREKALARPQLDRIDAVIPALQAFADAYAAGEADAAAAAAAAAVRRTVDDITSRYRIIQWMLYL